MNSEVANQLSIIENDQGQFLVGIEGRIIDFQKAGDLEAGLGAMVASDIVVEFQLSDTVALQDGPAWVPSWLSVKHMPVGRDYGGEATIDASRTPSGRISITIDPEGINDRQARREGIPGATLREATAHGFGHAQAYVQGIYGPGNRAAALRSAPPSLELVASPAIRVVGFVILFLRRRSFDLFRLGLAVLFLPGLPIAAALRFHLHRGRVRFL